MSPTPEEMAASMVANLPEKTGKSLDEWLAVVRRSGRAKHGEIVKHLKAEHALGHGYANLVAHHFRGQAGDAAPAAGDLVAAQYAGPKADLQPIYDEIVRRIASFGSDVEVSPKKTYVSLRRSKQFGLIQPSTRTRVDVGLNLGDTAPTERLEPSGSFNAMVSHRVRITAAEEVDDELEGWLRAAYERA